MKAQRVSGPPGSGHSPSAWRERQILIALALLGLAVSAYLALYQMGVVVGPWDPLFGSASSRQALHSFISRLLPLPDATFGVIGYLLEVVLASIGGRERWRTRPWVVVLYGIVVLGMGLVSLGLVFTQAFIVQAWCALCLLSALISIAVLLVAAREVLAAVRYLRQLSIP